MITTDQIHQYIWPTEVHTESIVLQTDSFLPIQPPKLASLWACCHMAEPCMQLVTRCQGHRVLLTALGPT